MPSIINATTTAGVAITGDNSGNLAIQTNNGNTAVTIDTSQNVGIGTSSPFGTAANRIVLSINGTTDANFTMGSGGSQRSYFVVSSSSVDLSTVGAIPLTFGTNASERMRINSDGNISVNSTSNSVSRFAVNQTTTSERCISAVTPASYGSAAFRSLSSATAGTGWYHFFGTSSTDTVSNIVIYGNGNIENANGVYGSISDIKLKENITDATPKLDKLMQVKVRNYNLKGDYEQHKQLGVIAQELETVFPGLIEETQDRGENDELLETTTKSVKYSVFVPMLIKAMQEQQAQIEELKAEVAALKGVA